MLKHNRLLINGFRVSGGLHPEVQIKASPEVQALFRADKIKLRF